MLSLPPGIQFTFVHSASQKFEKSDFDREEDSTSCVASATLRSSSLVFVPSSWC